MEIIERVLHVLEQKGKRMSELADHLGVGSSTVANWKARKTDPPAKFIIPICEFLDVSVEYILKGTEGSVSSFSLTEEEEKVLVYYNRLNVENRDFIKGEMISLHRRQNIKREPELSSTLEVLEKNA